VAEAIVFEYHSQFAAMGDFLREHSPLSHIDALFIIPPMPRENFRNSRRLGGGCLLDMGPYAAAIARRFGGEVDVITAFAAPSSRDFDVDLGFTAAVRFADGVRYTAHFSFESEYQNRLTLVARHGSLVVDRVFSPPADMTPLWQTRERNVAGEQRMPACDVFERFLQVVFGAVRSQQHQHLHANLLRDVRFRARLEQALLSNSR
jgi:predicted dehydrogenase